MLLAVFVLTIWVFFPTLTAQTPDYFPLTIGSKWTYNVTAVGAGRTVEKLAQVEITGKENAGGVDCYMQKTTMDGRVVNEYCYGWQNNKLLLYKGAFELSGSLTAANPQPPQIMLVTPLEPGSKWAWSGDIGTEKDTLQGEVGGRANVVVPAGAFDAYLVTLTLTSSSQSIVFSRWYAEGIGMVKQTEVIPFGGTTVNFSNELSSYDIAGGESSHSMYSQFPFLVIGVLVTTLVIGLVLVRRRLAKQKMKEEADDERLQREYGSYDGTEAKLNHKSIRALLAGIRSTSSAAPLDLPL